MIQRDIHTDLQEIIDNFPALMLYGPRQIGKTTLAKEIAANAGKTWHYFDLENENDRFLLGTNPTYFLQQYQNDLVILDEVQRLPSVLAILRGLIDTHRIPGRFILLGSADPALIKDISESLAGRIIYKEICQISLLEIEEKGISQEIHWFRGGFPEALLMKNNKLWTLWTESFITSYVYHDLNQLFGINLNAQQVLKLWNMLAHLNSELENLENLSRSMGMSSASLKRYLEYMQGAYLIRRLLPWYTNTGKRLVKSAKMYIRTSGILHHLLQIPDIDHLLRHPALGASWEAYVVEQIHTYLPSDLQAYFYRTHHGAEVDMVLVRGVQPVATVEIKFSNTPQWSRGLYQCVEDLQTTKNFIVTPASPRITTKEGFQILGLAEFLKEIQTERL